MKTEIEKKIADLNKSKSLIVAIDPSLNKYQGKVLFPKKLAIAEEKLKGETTRNQKASQITWVFLKVGLDGCRSNR